MKYKVLKGIAICYCALTFTNSMEPSHKGLTLSPIPKPRYTHFIELDELTYEQYKDFIQETTAQRHSRISTASNSPRDDLSYNQGTISDTDTDMRPVTKEKHRSVGTPRRGSISKKGNSPRIDITPRLDRTPRHDGSPRHESTPRQKTTPRSDESAQQEYTPRKSRHKSTTTAEEVTSPQEIMSSKETTPRKSESPRHEFIPRSTITFSSLDEILKKPLKIAVQIETQFLEDLLQFIQIVDITNPDEEKLIGYLGEKTIDVYPVIDKFYPFPQNGCIKLGVRMEKFLTPCWYGNSPEISMYNDLRDINLQGFRIAISMLPNELPTAEGELNAIILKNFAKPAQENLLSEGRQRRLSFSSKVRLKLVAPCSFANDEYIMERVLLPADQQKLYHSEKDMLTHAQIKTITDYLHLAFKRYPRTILTEIVIDDLMTYFNAYRIIDFQNVDTFLILINALDKVRNFNTEGTNS